MRTDPPDHHHDQRRVILDALPALGTGGLDAAAEELVAHLTALSPGARFTSRRPAASA